MPIERDIVTEEIDRIKAAFGEVVRRRRIDAGLEQRVFSRMANMGNSHLRQIEQGQVSPSLTTITKIALALGTDAGDLVSQACRLGDDPSRLGGAANTKK